MNILKAASMKKEEPSFQNPNNLHTEGTKIFLQCAKSNLHILEKIYVCAKCFDFIFI